LYAGRLSPHTGPGVRCAIRETLYNQNGLTLVEMLLALAIIGIVFAAILPQFRVIMGSWDSKQGVAEMLQNGRVLIDHLNRNLSKAVQITAVSDLSEVNGYIEFEDNDANTLRYNVDANSHVEFGVVGALYELAGPVSRFQFTCYDACDLDTPITTVADIRSVKVEATLTNTGPGQDKTFTAQAYLRTNLEDANGWTIAEETPFEFDTQDGRTPALYQIDSTHYLCAYEGDRSDGWAVVLTVDTGSWTITKETPFEFDTQDGRAPALSRIDSTHYLCAYEGDGSHGWAVVLTVDTGSWSITKEIPFEFDTKNGGTPALYKIDSSHYLCTYEGDKSDGWAVVLTVDTGGWTITEETPFEFDTQSGITPALYQLDSSHYLCAYEGDNSDGWAVVLTVDTGSWTITEETPFEFDTQSGITPALYQIDIAHYLCAYEGNNSDGWAVVLTVDTGSWTITEETPFEFDTQNGRTPALYQIDSSHYLCAYEGNNSDGWAVVLTVDTVSWSITKETLFEFDTQDGKTPALYQIDSSHYLCTYEGNGSDGWAVVLSIGESLISP